MTAENATLAAYLKADLRLIAEPGLLPNCLLLAAEAAVTGDAISANYHLAWFRELDASPVRVDPGS